MKKTQKYTINSIVKDYVDKSQKYHKEKNKYLELLYIALIANIIYIYMLLKIAKLFQLNSNIEITIIIIFSLFILIIEICSSPSNKKYKEILIDKNYNYIHNIDDIYHALLLRINPNFCNNIFSRYMTIFKATSLFYFGYFFNGIFNINPINETNIITMITFSFSLIISIILFIDIIRLLLNKTNLRYICLIEEIEEYKINKKSKTKIIDKIINYLRP